MKMIIAPVVVVLFTFAGAFAGITLKSSSGQSGDSHASSKEESKGGHGEESKKDEKDKKDAHGGKDDHGKAKKKTASKDKHGKSDHGSSKGDGKTVYYKFSREFVVPVMENERVKSLVILNIHLEVNEDAESGLFSLDPKLRDNIMTTLIGLSNDGATLEDLTSVDSYETIRSVVLMNLRNVVSTGIENVLIVDVGKQDLL